jgi:hypothetical protein
MYLFEKFKNTKFKSFEDKTISPEKLEKLAMFNKILFITSSCAELLTSQLDLISNDAIEEVHEYLYNYDADNQMMDLEFTDKNLGSSTSINDVVSYYRTLENFKYSVVSGVVESEDFF